MNPRLKGALRVSITLIVTIGAIVAAVSMWRHYEVEPWTRDGKVRADVVRIAPDVAGLVTAVLVRDNQHVDKGQALFIVDAPRYRLALAQVAANINSLETTLAQARREAARNDALGDLVAAEIREQGHARVANALAALAQAQAAANVAQLNVTRTTVRASVTGTVTNLQLRPGDYVNVGAQALALVDAASLHVDGYFEETKLSRIHIGDAAEVRLMGEDRVIKGRVESIAAGIDDRDRGTGTSQLPSVNPTFNWVRLAQRVPVRIRLIDVPKDMMLIAGRTATVQIMDRAGKGAS